MDKKIIKEIKSKVYRSAGHGYAAFGHFYTQNFDEAEEKTNEFRDEIDSLLEYLEGLES